MRHSSGRLAVLVSIMLLLGLFMFRHAGTWLIAQDTPPQHLDLICTFAGDGKRVEYSKELMLQHTNAHWLMSDYRNGHGRLLSKSNFDMRRVTIFDTCNNTLSEVYAVREWLDRNFPPRYKKSGHGTLIHVGLVSSPYHMRRIGIMAHRKLRHNDIRFYLLPVPLDRYNWTKDTYRYWWRSKTITSLTLAELLKTGYFLLTGYI